MTGDREFRKVCVHQGVRAFWIGAMWLALCLLAPAFPLAQQPDTQFNAGALQILTVYQGRPISEVQAQIPSLVYELTSSTFSNQIPISANDDLVKLNYLRPGIWRVHFYNKFYGTELTPLFPVTIVAGQTATITNDLAAVFGIVEGRITDNDTAPTGRFNLYASGSKFYYNLNVDTNGGFRFLATGEDSTLTSSDLSNKPIVIPFSAKPGQTLILPTVALERGILAVRYFYQGQPIESLNASTPYYCQISSSSNTPIRSYYFLNSSPTPEFFDVQTVTIRTILIAAKTNDAHPPTTIQLLRGVTNRIDVDLCGGLGLLTGKALNSIGKPFRASTSITVNGQDFFFILANTNGDFGLILPPGSYKAPFYSGGITNFVPFQITNCQTTDIGIIGTNNQLRRLNVHFTFHGASASNLLSDSIPSLYFTTFNGHAIPITQGWADFTQTNYFNPSTLDVGAIFWKNRLTLPLLPGPAGTDQLQCELSNHLGLIEASCSLGGRKLPPNTSIRLAATNYNFLTRPTPEGNIRLLIPPGEGSISIYPDTGGAMPYSISAGQTNHLGLLDFPAGDLSIQPLFRGQPVGTIASNINHLSVTLPSVTQQPLGNTMIVSNLPTGSQNVVVGPLTTSATILSGQTTHLDLELARGFGILRGYGRVNLAPASSGAMIEVISSQQVSFTFKPDAAGAFSAVLPAGNYAGHFNLILGAGDFEFKIMAGQITDLGDVLANISPTVTFQPRSITVPAGSDATLSVAANGSLPLIYQWYRDGNILLSNPGSSLTLNNLLLSDSGTRVYVVVLNRAGAMRSESAIITVTNPTGPPTLTLRKLGQDPDAEMQASWPITAVGYQLESTTNLDSADWKPVRDKAITNRALFSVTQPKTNAVLFYRLIKSE